MPRRQCRHGKKCKRSFIFCYSPGVLVQRIQRFRKLNSFIIKHLINLRNSKHIESSCVRMLIKNFFFGNQYEYKHIHLCKDFNLCILPETSSCCIYEIQLTKQMYFVAWEFKLCGELSFFVKKAWSHFCNFPQKNTSQYIVLPTYYQHIGGTFQVNSPRKFNMKSQPFKKTYFMESHWLPKLQTFSYTFWN
jgi:hypothetical protein